MRRFRIRPWMILAIVLLALLIAFFSTFFLTGGGGTSVEGVAGSAAEPAVEGASGFGASIRDFFGRLFALRDVDKQYEQLKTENQMLKTQNQFMQDLQSENERLMKLLEFKTDYPTFKCLPAHVIGKEPGSWFISFTLNRGSDQGVAKDMSVVNELGLVGRVVSVGHNWCKVMAVIDRQSYVSGIVQGALDSCMVHGSGDPQGSNVVCDIYHLTPTSAVVPGDKVVTSDMGGIFPKGLLIGTVSEVDQDKTQNSFARLIPAVDFAHVDYVLIITSDKHVPTEQEIAAEESKGATVSPQAAVSPSPSPEEKP